MPKLRPDTQIARREHILDAAEICFARAGFHRTTMQDICRQAGVSPGAIYVYFASKEELIAGLCERNRAEFAKRLDQFAAGPDLISALTAMGEQYFVDEPPHKSLMTVEMGIESTRNAQVGGIYRSVDQYVIDSFEQLFGRLKETGRIAPILPIPELARTFIVIGDGLFWRRAIDPAFDGKSMVEAVTKLAVALLNPLPEAPAVAGKSRRDGVPA